MRNSDNFCFSLQKAEAIAVIKGSEKYPYINGKVHFFTVADGVVVRAYITGLPKGNGACNNLILAFHIHGGSECSGKDTDPFANADGHYNPNKCQHPYHAGDMPPLFTVNGKAFLAFLTNRFTISEIKGKTVIIHKGMDDFTMQPSGNAGEKIACGVIMTMWMSK